MTEPTLGSDHLLPYETGAASPASAASSFEDLAGAILGEAPTDPNEPAPEAEAEGEPDEVEQAESEESTEEEGADEQDEVEPGDSPETRLHKFRGAGKDHEVPYDELLRFAAAGVDYTHKSMGVAEEKREALRVQEAARAERDKYAQRLPALEAVLAETMPPEPDDALRQSNPGEFAAQREERRAHKEKLDAIRSEQDGIRAQQEREHNDRYVAHMEGEEKALLAAVPEWKDEARASAEKGKIVQYANSLGMDTAYLESVTDHRFMLLLRDSMLYREAQTKGKEAIREKVAAAPQVLKPGGRPQQNTANKAKRGEVQRLAEKLEKSGRTDDAAKLFEHLF